MMRVPVIESVNKWKDHFEKMAKGKITSNSIYKIPIQQGRGAVGNSYRNDKKIFSVQSGSGPASLDGTIISPVKNALDQTKSELKNKRKTIKGVSKKRSVSVKKRSPRGNTKKKTVKKGRVIKSKKKTYKRKTPTRKSKSGLKKKTATKRKRTTKNKTTISKRRKITSSKKKATFVCKQK